jgi:small-conductance mechanosensitive channel
MRSWLLRGLVFAFGMVVLRVIQSMMINTWEAHATMISLVLVAIYAIVALVWGYIDGRADAKAQPDPDRRGDLAMTWLLAGLVAGILSGAVAWLIGQFYTTMYVAGLVNEITTFAAFTALLVFLMATMGVAAGRGIWDRAYEKTHPTPHHEVSHGPDTDVFAAVKDDGTTQETPTR